MSTQSRGKLDSLGILHGTDKSSQRHNYLDIYDEHLAHMAETATSILEIGVYNGSSLRMWADYFPKARVVGVDIKPAARAYAGDRVAVEIGNAGDRAVLNRIAAEYGPFDLVVDDGSHRWDHQILAFECLFPALRPRGIFIIEDLHTSYFPKYGTPDGEPTTVWLRRQLDLLLATGNEPEAPRTRGVPEEAIWRKQVRQCTILRKAAIIQRV